MNCELCVGDGVWLASLHGSPVMGWATSPRGDLQGVVTYVFGPMHLDKVGKCDVILSCVLD